MRRRTSLLALGTSVVMAVFAAAMVTSAPSSTALPVGSPALVAESAENAMCADASASGRPPETTETQVKPPCCSSNCVTNRDCDRICGKGVCVCIATNSCCSRCTY